MSMKFGSSSWLVIYTKSIPCFTHLQRPYPNRQFPESEIFSQSNWKSEIYHILSEGRESPQSPYNRKTANTAFHLKPSRRWWQSPQLHVKIKPVSLLPPSSGASLTDSHGAEQWQPVINMSPEESQAAEPCRLEDKLSYTSWAAEVGIPHESPRLVQIGFTPSSHLLTPLCEGLNFPFPTATAILQYSLLSVNACAEGNAMVLWLYGHKREVSRTQQTKLQFLSPLGFPSTPCLWNYHLLWADTPILQLVHWCWNGSIY